MAQLWKLFCDELYAMSTIWNGHVHAAVLMSNHYHILMSTPDANIGDCMCDFQSEFARKISILKGTNGYRFASRYKWSLIQTEQYFLTALKYLYLNPVRAGLTERAELYNYSTLNGLVGQNPLFVPIKAAVWGTQLFDTPPTRWINWINEPYSKLQNRAIKVGLQRSVFVPAFGKMSCRERDELCNSNFEFAS